MKIRGKKLVKRLVLCTLVCLLLFVTVGGGIAYFTVPICIGEGKTLQITQEPNMSATLTEKQASADASQMVAFLEEVHPIFLKKQTAQYQKSKKAYLLSTQKSMNVSDFGMLTSRFLTTLNDGHTRIYWVSPMELSVSWKWINGSLIVGDHYGLPENSQVVSIGGEPISKIVSTVDTLFPEENDAACAVERETYIKCLPVLEAAGVGSGNTVNISVSLNGIVSEKTFPFKTVSNTNIQPYVEGKVENGAYVVTLRSCELGSELDKTVVSLKKAVSGGIKKVIVDVRDNPGGNSDACLKILNALNISPGEYGGIIRFSKPASEQRGYLRTNGEMILKPNNNSKHNSNIQLYVVTNESTFSSATMLAVLVQDGHLGKVVGQPSGNMPSSYGDVIEFQLNNSKLCGSVSYKQWIRPDITKTCQKELVPDIVVPADKDALEVALNTVN